MFEGTYFFIFISFNATQLILLGKVTDYGGLNFPGLNFQSSFIFNLIFFSIMF